MADIKIYNPSGLAHPAGPFCHIADVTGQRLAFIAGQTPVDENGATVGKSDFEAQAQQVFANIHAALRALGGDWKNVVQFTSYLVRPEDSAAFRAFRGREFSKMFPGGAYPPNTLLIINRLADPDYWLEVQTVAAL
ncbi:MAG TPA: RidA family protein [Xanthobacteraceae bacterium]|jgi:enamine deaminase RidA (YjgF/YER057c/UK114 family)|nr:RidA family protein [Xanthobacteraceae bacterium]